MEIASKQKLAEAAKTLARSYELIQHNTTTFIPAHWDTLDLGPCMPTTDRVWLLLTVASSANWRSMMSKLVISESLVKRTFETLFAILCLSLRVRGKECFVEDRIQTEAG